MTVDVKICGLRTPAGVKAAVEAGAHYAGFVFQPSSSRFVTAEEAASLSRYVPPTVARVGLFVDVQDDDLRGVLEHVALDILQLHGNETPARAESLRAMTGIPVMKALRIATADDLKPVLDFAQVADWLLFDTKVGEEPTGGTGKSFDWTLIRGLKLPKPWMLAGGLKTTNLSRAIEITGALTVDVSSGVEDATGQKDPDKIREFIKLASEL